MKSKVFSQEWYSSLKSSSPESLDRKQHLEEFLCSWRAGIYHWLLQRFDNLDPADIEDIYQDSQIKWFVTFSKMHWVGSMVPTKDELAGTLRTIARRAAIDRIRSNKRMRFEQLPETGVSEGENEDDDQALMPGSLMEEGSILEEMDAYYVTKSRLQAFELLLNDPKRTDCAQLLQWYYQHGKNGVSQQAYEAQAAAMGVLETGAKARAKVLERLNYCRMKMFQRAITNFNLQVVLNQFVESAEIRYLIKTYWDDRLAAIAYVKERRKLRCQAGKELGIVATRKDDTSNQQIEEFVVERLSAGSKEVWRKANEDPAFEKFIEYLAVRSGDWRATHTPIVAHRQMNDEAIGGVCEWLSGGASDCYPGAGTSLENDPLWKENLRFFVELDRMVGATFSK